MTEIRSSSTAVPHHARFQVCHFLSNLGVGIFDIKPLTKISSCNWKNGPDSSVGIATDYGLGGPGSNPGEDEIFPPVQTGTQPPVQWASGISWGLSAAGACC